MATLHYCFGTLVVYLLAGICVSTYCDSSPASSYKLKEVPLGGNLTFEIKHKTIIQNLFLYQLNESGYEKCVLSINSYGPPEFYDSHLSDEKRAKVINRSADRHAVTIDITDMGFSDAGIYLLQWNGLYETKKECSRVFVLGPPTDPVITFVPRQEDDALDTFICTSNSTTTPKTHNWMLKYFFSVNGNVIGQHSHQTGFVVKENMLFTAKRDLTITCIVQEENSHPIRVSTTKSFIGYNVHYLKSAATGPTQSFTQQSKGNDSNHIRIGWNCWFVIIFCCLNFLNKLGELPL